MEGMPSQGRTGCGCQLSVKQGTEAVHRYQTNVLTGIWYRLIVLPIASLVMEVS